LLAEKLSFAELRDGKFRQPSSVAGFGRLGEFTNGGFSAPNPALCARGPTQSSNHDAIAGR